MILSKLPLFELDSKAALARLQLFCSSWGTFTETTPKGLKDLYIHQIKISSCGVSSLFKFNFIYFFNSLLKSIIGIFHTFDLVVLWLCLLFIIILANDVLEVLLIHIYIRYWEGDLTLKISNLRYVYITVGSNNPILLPASKYLSKGQHFHINVYEELSKKVKMHLSYIKLGSMGEMRRPV